MSVSASTSASEQDLPSKYRRLASAYAKIRSELKMVRNTLQEEEIRGRNKSMQLNESEARIQRLEAEVESLNFRNIQLEKRVSVLRKELETSRMDYDSKMPARASSRISLFRKMSHSTSEQIIDPARCALENELATKIADNESLVKKIRDMEVAYETEMEQRKRRIAELEADNLSLQQQLHTAVEDQETQMSELQRCHRTLTERFQTLQNECSKERQLAKKWESANVEVFAKLRSTEESLQRLQARETFFQKPELEKCYQWGSAVQHLQSANDIYRVLSAIAVEIKTVAFSAQNYFSYNDARLRLYPADELTEETSSEVKQCCNVLPRAVDSCRTLGGQVDTALSNLCSNCRLMKKSDVLLVQKAISDVVEGFSKFSIWFKKCLEAESAVPWCDTKLAEENLNYYLRLQEFLECVRKFSSSASASSPSIDSGSSEFQFNRILDLLRTCSRTADVLSSSYELKVAAEHSLPVATKKLKATNECIAAVLNAISKSLQKIIKICETDRQIVTSYFSYVMTVSDFLHPIIRSSCIYNATLSQVPFEFTAAESTSTASAFPDMFARPLDTAMTSKNQSEEWLNGNLFTELAKEKEHWQTETKILKLKLHYALGSKNVEDYDLAESTLLREYYNEKLAKTTKELYLSQGRSTFLSRELRNMVTVFNITCQKNSELRTCLKRYQKTISLLKEQIKAIREGYEKQMTSMSDHMANLSRTLTSQSDEIDMLRQINLRMM